MPECVVNVNISPRKEVFFWCALWVVKNVLCLKNTGQSQGKPFLHPVSKVVLENDMETLIV